MSRNVDHQVTMRFDKYNLRMHKPGNATDHAGMRLRELHHQTGVR